MRKLFDLRAVVELLSRIADSLFPFRFCTVVVLFCFNCMYCGSAALRAARRLVATDSDARAPDARAMASPRASSVRATLERARAMLHDAVRRARALKRDATADEARRRDDDARATTTTGRRAESSPSPPKTPTDSTEKRAKRSSPTSSPEDAREEDARAKGRARRAKRARPERGGDGRAPFERAERARGMYFNSASFTMMSATPEVDSDDDGARREIDESARLIHEFTDLAEEELQYMVKWNSVALRFRCLGRHESPALCEAFARTHWRSLREKDFFSYYLRTVLAMYEFGAIDRAGVVHALRVAADVTGRKCAGWRRHSIH